MSFPLEFTGILSGLLCGLVFGFALERAGFASACNLTAQLRFKDWRVFKVMFTAIIVAAFGLFFLQAGGVMAKNDIYIPTVFLWATLLGGVGVGAGMAVGGYCPGTSVVGFVSGKIDGLVFFIGLALGTYVFAGAYEAIAPILEAVPGPTAQTVPELLNLPTIVVLLMLLACLVGVGWMTRDKKPAATAASAAAPAGATAQAS
ncbi:YeeE/YedE thiosulfate transporter family protein [Polycyclovorans algicola]|uniref:YeeE/YedE thiosulfate transporter family protein n=1 Tax=Polycyclovorans algicola TaxID=616992 RepID=UPI0004A6FD64|nr:YeeE/YedE thiosulfate transporter family protein [Polycyclovorans algicola]